MFKLEKSDKISSLQFEVIFEAMRGIRFVLLTDAPQFTIVAVSDDACRYFGMKRNEIVGKSVSDVFGPHAMEFAESKHVREVFEHVLIHKVERQEQGRRPGVRVSPGNLEEMYWNNYSTPVLNDRKEVLYIVHTIEDITQQIVSAQESRQSLEVAKAYQLLMQAPWVIGIAKGPDYVLEMANASALRLWNKGQEIIGRSLKETIPELSGQGIFEIFDHVRVSGSVFHASEHPVTTYINSKQELRYFDMIYQPFYDDGNTEPSGVFTMSYDVTDMVVARHKLEESETRLQKTISIETVGVIYFNLRGWITDCNRAFEKMSGYTREEMKEGKIKWSELTPPEFADVTMRSLNQFKNEGQNTPYEKQYVRPDDSRWWGLVAGKRLNEDECVEFVVDITLIKQVEEELETRVKARTHDLERLTEELLRSNQSLEQFAYAASHDMKEPLRKALLFCDRLKSSYGDDLTGERSMSFAKLENSVKRMQTLIDDLLAYSHLSFERHRAEELDIYTVIEAVLGDLDLEIDEKKALIKIGPLCRIHGHPRQLQQLFQNLIANALKYSRADVRPEIVITCDLVDVERFGVKKFHLINVSDNGIGFEQHHAEKIFDVFTRLHGYGKFKGTGIGLSIVRKVMESHHGFVEAEGVPGKGSVFKLYFPVGGDVNVFP